ncbi:MAG: hypothetical protein CSA68_10690 [Rhodobacterales bacterium]|nr:MAG: hypothetical protein CSA68_10690 [Rhodobacterales bacterium]
MRHVILTLFIAAIAVPATAPMAEAGGKIRRACMKSDRQASSHSLCSCIQQAADQTLSRSDQRKAAKFFKDPQMAQDVKMSKNAGNDAFWDRYKKFGATARNYCG